MYISKSFIIYICWFHWHHLKVNNIHQLKYATDEDFLQVGLSRPEVRRLRKIFHKHCPQNYLYKFKNVRNHKSNSDCTLVEFTLPEHLQID